MSAAVAAGVEARVRERGLLAPGRAVVVLLSGGRDSVCLLDLAARIAGAGAVSALHVDYGLRESSAADAAACEQLCERLGVALEVQRPDGPPRGNVQAWARDERYARAEALARGRDAEIATGHTATDQVETVLYRLAASPGRRALLGIAERDGRIVRPLLGVSRAETGMYCAERGLQWRDDPTNETTDYARNRIRAEIVPALRSLHPAAEENVLRTLAVLRDEAAVLDEVVDGALREAGWDGGAGAVPARALAEMPRALRRLAVQRLADAVAGPRPPAVGHRTGEIMAAAELGGTRSLDVGGGLRAVVSYGELRFEPAGGAPAAVPGAVELPVPGRVGWAGGELTCERGEGIAIGDGTLDADAIEAPLEVRAWRPGDRMRPLGMEGSRSLQDLFTDRRIPRDRRHRTPVVVSGGEIAWVPGVATGDRFKVTGATRERVRLAWRT